MSPYTTSRINRKLARNQARSRALFLNRAARGALSAVTYAIVIIIIWVTVVILTA